MLAVCCTHFTATLPLLLHAALWTQRHQNRGSKWIWGHPLVPRVRLLYNSSENNFSRMSFTEERYTLWPDPIDLYRNRMQCLILGTEIPFPLPLIPRESPRGKNSMPRHRQNHHKSPSVLRVMLVPDAQQYIDSQSAIHHDLIFYHVSHERSHEMYFEV